MFSLIQETIPPIWSYVRTIKRVIEEKLVNCPEAARYATGMVASELIGNAIKYGDNSDPATRSMFRVSCADGKIIIEVTNRVKSIEHFEQVRRRIDQMESSSNKEDFYLNRLQELLSGDAKGSQLGLYRIGYEGEFALSYVLSDNNLTIRATRGLG